jgi:H-NS histone C-terminal domain
MRQETRTVPEWEYRKIDLSEQRPRSNDLDTLNAAGADGWELVGITNNNVAYLKRRIEELARAPSEDNRGVASSAKDGIANGSGERGQQVSEVKAKYRDPMTNETWSGRGRMANWLKRKQDAGEDIEKYLV